MKEAKFQRKLKALLSDEFPGCIILKNDPTFTQGIPDLLILYKNQWAALEVKESAYAPYRPNQSYYLARMDDMSCSDVVYPENVESVIDRLHHFFRRTVCNSTDTTT